MTDLYKRKYELTIGEAGKDGKQFTDLNIRFKIEKTGDSSTNKAEIEIYNLTESSRKFVSKKDLAVTLKAGYEDNFGLIFAGYTTFTHTTKGRSKKDDYVRRGFEHMHREDADWISVINADDGLKALKHYISLSLDDDKLTELQVLRKVVDKLNESVKVATGTLKGIKDTRINNGYAVSTTFKNILDKICKKQQLQHMILDGVLYIRPKNQPIADEIIKLDYESGLIGSPEPTEEGYKFTSLLRHDINIGSLIEVEAELIKGRFVVMNLTHNGELESNQWFTVCECIPVGLK